MADLLVLIRHGEPEGGAAGRLRGRSDAPLSALGCRQAAWAGSVVASLPPTADARYYTSPLRRARQTAALALEGTGREAAVLDDLVEVDVGEWEGLDYAEAAERDPEEAARWAVWDPGFRFPGGESLAGFLERVEGVCRTLADVDAETVVAFSHGGVIRSSVCHLLGLDSRQYLLFDVGPACVVSIRLYDGGGVLRGLRNCDVVS